jgi:hypothetical protein
MKKNLNTILLIAIILFIGWYVFLRKVELLKPIIDYRYKTDTIFIDTLYVPGKPYPVHTPPKIVKIYVIDTAALDSIKLALNEKEIIISGLKESIAISVNYLKQFPSNPKLLAMDLTRDTLKLGLLSITGQVQENVWPIDLNQFNYRWNYGSDLSRHPVQSPPIKEKPFADYFIGGGVDIPHTTPYVSFRMEKNWTRIRLYGDMRVVLLNNNRGSINIGADYKLWQNR